MDPDTTLAKARQALTALISSGDGSGPADWQDVTDLCDSFASLDAWLTAGGFLPTDWATL